MAAHFLVKLNNVNINVKFSPKYNIFRLAVYQLRNKDNQILNNNKNKDFV